MFEDSDYPVAVIGAQELAGDVKLFQIAQLMGRADLKPCERLRMWINVARTPQVGHLWDLRHLLLEPRTVLNERNRFCAGIVHAYYPSLLEAEIVLHRESPPTIVHSDVDVEVAAGQPL
jgi:hypothetical protein